MEVQTTVTHTDRVEEIAAEIGAGGWFALDLEFVSEGRYLPELALVQVGWGDESDPKVAAIDPLLADPGPIGELVADSAVTTVLHSGQGDLTLLAEELGVTGRGIIDSQIAAAFVGIGDQIGYAGLVEALFGIELDKAMQFTQWLDRPLSAEQLRYALDDVRYLPRAWRELEARLAEAGRLPWVEHESARMAEDAAVRLPPEEAYRKLKGWQRLPTRQRALLAALAEWREGLARKQNRPLSWILKDKALREVVRRKPATLKALKRIEGIGPGTVRRYGDAILETVRDGLRAEAPLGADGPPPQRLTDEGKKMAVGLFKALVERCRELEIAPRFVASRSEVDDLVRWWTTGDRSQEPELRFLEGWRRDLVGGEILARLAD